MLDPGFNDDFGRARRAGVVTVLGVPAGEGLGDTGYVTLDVPGTTETAAQSRDRQQSQDQFSTHRCLR